MNESKIKGIWLSKEVLSIAELNIKEKLILSLAINLNNNGKSCFASNKFIGSLVDVSPNRVSKLVSSLKDKGYIRVKIRYKQNSKEIETREIIPIGEKIKGYCQKEQEGYGTNDQLPIGENNKDKINNNKNNNYNKEFKNENKYFPYFNTQFQNIDFDKYYAI